MNRAFLTEVYKVLVSEFIERLQQFQREHGDLPVDTGNPYIGRYTHEGPVLAYRRVLKGRERTEGFAQAYEPERRGEPVCRV